MNRRNIETFKIIFMGACTLLCVAEAAYLRQASFLAMALFFGVCTAYFVWERSVFTRLESRRNAPRQADAQVTLTRGAGDSKRLATDLLPPARAVVCAAGAQLAISALVLAGEIAFFDQYSAAFIEARGGTTVGVGVGLGLRAVFAIGWGASFRRLVDMLGTGGARALSLAALWAVTSGAGFAIAASRDITPWLVLADLARAAVGLGVGVALVAPSFRRGLRAGR